MEATAHAQGVRDIVASLAHDLGGRREEYERNLLAMMREEVKPLSPDNRLLELLRTSITENILAALSYLEDHAGEREVGPSPGVIGHARTLAQRDIPLSSLIRAYRIGHARMLDFAMAHATRTLPEAILAPVIIDLVNRSAQFVDRTCEQVGLAYEQERDRWVSSRSGLRQKWVEAVLTDPKVDLGQAAAMLGYPFDGHHVAVLAWCEPSVPASHAVALFDQARVALDEFLRTRRPPLLVPVDEHEARIWFSSSSVDTAAVARVSGRLGVRTALGNPEEGVAGFRRSLRQAVAVKEVCVASPGGTCHSVAYRDVAWLSLMAHDLDGLAHFVATTLGGLGQDTERAARLRETLRVFLAHNRSFTATAAAMNLHRNTVQYRIEQALALCTADPLDVAVALTACKWLGSTVLQRS